MMGKTFAAAFFLTAFSFTISFGQYPPKPTPTPEASAPESAETRKARPYSGKPWVNGQYVRPTLKARWGRYVQGMVGPLALARQIGGAGISTWRNSPEEWGGTWEGFGKRVASNFGRNVIKRSVTFGIDEALKQDSHYYRSTKKDAGSKIRNAFVSLVTARNVNGKRVFSLSRPAGAYAAGIIAAETWYPARYDWKDGVRNGTISLGITAGYNLLKEFILQK